METADAFNVPVQADGDVNGEETKNGEAEGDEGNKEHNDGSDKKYQEAKSKARKIIIKKLVELHEKVSDLFGDKFAEEVTDAMINRFATFHYGMRDLDPTTPNDQYLLMKNTTYVTEFFKGYNQDEFDMASISYLLRRSRRIFL